MDYDDLAGVDVGCENGDVGPGGQVDGALERVVGIGRDGEFQCEFVRSSGMKIAVTAALPLRVIDAVAVGDVTPVQPTKR